MAKFVNSTTGNQSSASQVAAFQRLSEQQRSRREVLGIGIALAGCLGTPWSASNALAQSGPAVASKRKGLLVRPSDVVALDTRSKIVLELEGELQLKEPDPSKPEQVRRAEVRGKSTLDYFEKIAFEDSKLSAAARNYVEAKAENWISGSASTQELRSECRETRMLQHDGTWQQYCVSEPLDLRETELLHSPVNSAALELLLPIDPAKPSSTWDIEADAAKELFNLDAVHESTVTAKIEKVESGVATIQIEGKLRATAGSVSTTLEIKGSYNAKIASQCAMVTWLGLVIKETRDISQAEPGFQITARIRMIRAETGNEFAISADELRQLAAQADEGQWLVRMQSMVGRYTMLGDRRWRTYLDTGEEAILRLIENNDVIAQCNITRLPKLDAGSQLTLEGMQQDIKTSLGEGFQEFLESKESVTSNKLRLLRSVVSGMAEDVPVQWVYTHLSDDDGRRYAMIFTMGGNVTDKFAAADEQMTSSFQLLAVAKDSDAPTPAPEGERSAAKTGVEPKR